MYMESKQTCPSLLMVVYERKSRLQDKRFKSQPASWGVLMPQSSPKPSLPHPDSCLVLLLFLVGPVNCTCTGNGRQNVNWFDGCPVSSSGQERPLPGAMPQRSINQSVVFVQRRCVVTRGAHWVWVSCHTCVCVWILHGHAVTFTNLYLFCDYCLDASGLLSFSW